MASDCKVTQGTLLSLLSLNSMEVHTGFLIQTKPTVHQEAKLIEEYRLCYNFSPKGILGPMIEILTRKDAELAGWFFVGAGRLPEFADKISDVMFKNLKWTMYEFYSAKYSNLKKSNLETELRQCESWKGLVILRSQNKKNFGESEHAHYLDIEIYEYDSPFQVKNFIKGLVRFQKGDNPDVPITPSTVKSPIKNSQIVVDLISDDEEIEKEGQPLATEKVASEKEEVKEDLVGEDESLVELIDRRKGITVSASNTGVRPILSSEAPNHASTNLEDDAPKATNRQQSGASLTGKRSREEGSQESDDCFISNDSASVVGDVHTGETEKGLGGRKRNKHEDSEIEAGNVNPTASIDEQQNLALNLGEKEAVEGDSHPGACKIGSEGQSNQEDEDDVSLEKIVEKARSLDLIAEDEERNVNTLVEEVSEQASCKAGEEPGDAGNAQGDLDAMRVDMKEGEKEAGDGNRQDNTLITSHELKSDKVGDDQVMECEKDGVSQVESKHAVSNSQVDSPKPASQDCVALSQSLATFTRHCQIYKRIWNAFSGLAIGKDMPAILNARPNDLMKASKSKILEVAHRTGLFQQDKAAILISSSSMFSIMRVAFNADQCQAQGLLVGKENANGRTEVTGVVRLDQTDCTTLDSDAMRGALAGGMHGRVVGIFRSGEDNDKKFPGAPDLELQNNVESAHALLGLICTVSRSRKAKSMCGISKITFVGYQTCGERKTWSIVEEPFCPVSSRSVHSHSHEDINVHTDAFDLASIQQATRNLRIQQAYLKAKLNILRLKCSPILSQPRNTVPFAMTFNLIKLTGPRNSCTTVLKECDEKTKINNQDPNQCLSESCNDNTLELISVVPDDSAGKEKLDAGEDSLKNEAVDCISDASNPDITAT